jgi:hypothetical protein
MLLVLLAATPLTGIKVRFKRLYRVRSHRNVLQPNHGTISLEQHRCGHHDILDLAPIQSLLGKLAEGPVSSQQLCAFFRDVRDECIPKAEAHLVRQRRKVDGQVDSGFDSLVENGNAVGGEEEDSLEVFENAKEDWVLLAYRIL